MKDTSKQAATVTMSLYRSLGNNQSIINQNTLT